MADFFGNTFKANILNWVFGKGSPATPAGVVFLSLHTADPGVDGQTANEATGTGYARKACVAADWGNPSVANPSVISNVNALLFATAGGSWSSGSNMTYMGMWNHATNSAAANFIGRAPLTTPQSFNTGQAPNFAIGEIDIDLADTV